jgi:hypothetical protein
VHALSQDKRGMIGLRALFPTRIKAIAAYYAPHGFMN